MVDIEIEPIADLIDLDGTPPCEVFVPSTGELCGKESVVRIRSHCDVCKAELTRFVCEGHKTDLSTGKVGCAYCYYEGRDPNHLAYRES